MQGETLNITGRALSAPDLTYNRSVIETNSVLYIETSVDDGERDEIKLLRNIPTVDAEKNFRGNVRTTQRGTKDVSVPNNDGTGNLMAPIVVEVKVTAPVGALQADIDDMVDRQTLLAKSAQGQDLHSFQRVI